MTPSKPSSLRDPLSQTNSAEPPQAPANYCVEPTSQVGNFDERDQGISVNVPTTRPHYSHRDRGTPQFLIDHDTESHVPFGPTNAWGHIGHLQGLSGFSTRLAQELADHRLRERRVPAQCH